MKISEQSTKRNRAPCGPRGVFRHVATAIATSPRYETEYGGVQQTVAIFRTQRTAAHEFATLSSNASHRCFERYVAREVSIEARAPTRGVGSQILNVEPRGQRSSASRFNVLVEAAVSTTVTVDVLLNQIGRSISSVSVIWRQITNGIEFQEVLVTKIAARLQGLLAQAATARRGHSRPM